MIHTPFAPASSTFSTSSFVIPTIANTEITQYTKDYFEELEKDINADRIAHAKEPLKKEEITETKIIKVSTTDPESGYMVRDGKPSFADSKKLHGLRYCRMRRIKKVSEQCFLKATVQNIKRIARVLSHYFLLISKLFSTCICKSILFLKMLRIKNLVIIKPHAFE